MYTIYKMQRKRHEKEQYNIEGEKFPLIRILLRYFCLDLFGGKTYMR